MSASRRPSTSPPPSSTFCRTWLNVRRDLIQFFDDKELQKLADDVRTSEGACCAKVAALLNRASDQIHDKLCPAAERIGMYDVLEAHRWMVAERKLLHRDISHGNIIVEAKDAPHIQRFTDTKRPIFINEVLHGPPAPPMARLLDMDHCTRLKTTRAQVESDGDEDEGPLESCTGTPIHPGAPSSETSPSNTLLGKRAHGSLTGDARSKRMRKTGDDEPLGAASQAAPDPPRLLEGEGENISGL
ncbi:hypothetical protein AB1N83_012749 [Pleurotus pulmonarius]